jgi:MFS family permease
VGRKKVIVSTAQLMAIASALILFLPDHYQMGSIAGIMLVVLRLIQGIALSGETIISWIYISEDTPIKTSPFYLSVLASLELCGGILVLGLGYLTIEYGWWWKTPFIFTTAFVFFSLYLRKLLRESPDYTKHLTETVNLSSRDELVNFYKQRLFQNKNFYTSISFFYLYPIAFIISYVYLGNLLIKKGFVTQQGLYLNNMSLSLIEIVIGLSVGSLFLKFDFVSAKVVTLIKYITLLICCFLPLFYPSFFLETHCGIFLMQSFLVTLSMTSLIIASCFKTIPTLGRCSAAGTSWAIGKVFSFFVLLYFNTLDAVGSFDIIFKWFIVLLVVTTICSYLYVPYEKLDEIYLKKILKKENVSKPFVSNYKYGG